MTNQNGGLPTSLMVNAPPNHNSLKDYSLQQINNGDNRRVSINCTESIKQGRKKKKGGGGGRRVSTLTYLSDQRFDTYSSLRYHKFNWNVKLCPMFEP